MTQAPHMAPAAFPEWPDGRRPALGWGLSLLVHATAIVCLWQALPPRPAHPDTQAARRIEVWLVPGAANVSPPAPAAADRGTRSHPALTPAVPGPTSILRQPRSSATPAAPVVSQPPPVDVTPAARASQNDAAQVPDRETPAFDLVAARAAARTMVGAERKGSVAPSLRQDGKDATVAPSLRQDGKDATTSERMQERFERARRPDCLKANESMNLLASVASLAKGILQNAVDNSGCKW